MEAAAVEESVITCSKQSCHDVVAVKKVGLGWGGEGGGKLLLRKVVTCSRQSYHVEAAVEESVITCSKQSCQVEDTIEDM